jgi:hypothetical protein
MSLPDNHNAQEQLTDAIVALQTAIKKEAFDKKGFRVEVVKAANILLGILGLQAVGPDIEAGQ